RRAEPHFGVAPRCAAGGQPAVRRGAPDGPVHPRAVPQGQLPGRRRHRVDRGPWRAGLQRGPRAARRALPEAAVSDTTRGGAGGRSSPELSRLRAEIDELDRRIVSLLNERAELTRAVWHEKVAIGRRAIRDRDREREVLLRVSIANDGPMPQVDLLAVYRRLIASARALETAERERLQRDADEAPEPPSA